MTESYDQRITGKERRALPFLSFLRECDFIAVHQGLSYVSHSQLGKDSVDKQPLVYMKEILETGINTVLNSTFS